MPPSLKERYVASMVLSGVGDAMGYRNAGWEFNMSGEAIHDDCEKRGGVANLLIALPDFRVSDDTVMHLATAEALIESNDEIDNDEKLFSTIARKYKESMDDMSKRGVGLTCRGAYALEPHREKGYCVPFDERGGGCGAAMRAMCIGLRYPRPEELDSLIKVCCESGRMTHHHPTAYLGALAAALFVSYAIHGKPVIEWGAGLMATLPKAQDYIISAGRYVDENINAWSYFTQRWTLYLKTRGISDGMSQPTFPENYDVKARDQFYTSLSFDGWGGASGHDAPMIAYDALLGSGDDWIELCKRGVLHGGDNDSTGVIAGACFGAMFGFHGVPDKNFMFIEYHDRLVKCAELLLRHSHPDLAIDDQEVYGQKPEPKGDDE